MSRERERKRNLLRAAKPIIDAFVVLLSFAAAYWIRYEWQWIREVEEAYLVPFSVYLPSVALYMIVQVSVYWLDGAYRDEVGRTYFDEFQIVLRATLVGIAMMIVIIFLATPSYYSRLIFFYAGLVTLLTMSISRAIERSIVRWRRQRGIGVRRVLIVGAGEIGRSVMRAVVARPEIGYQIAGFVDDDPTKAQTDIGRYPALGTTANLAELIREHAVDEAIITLPWASHAKITAITKQCELQHVTVRIIPDLFQMAMSNVIVEYLDGIPLLGVREPPLHDWQVVLKRGIDVLVAIVGLVLLSPVLLILGVAIRIETPGGAIFRQARVGQNGHEFTCLKLRSMVAGAESELGQLRERNEATGPLFKIREDPRRTRVGRFVRRTSLDELPQLWNVLRGEMSLIGPRPAIPAEVLEYEPWHSRRLDVRPGITGLWQVSGRSNLTFDEMVLLDIYYIENWSPIMDLRILLKTVPTVLLGSGAY